MDVVAPLIADGEPAVLRKPAQFVRYQLFSHIVNLPTSGGSENMSKPRPRHPLEPREVPTLMFHQHAPRVER